MVTIRPVSHALVPRDSAAADQIMGPNYDEFQSDQEVWNIIQTKPNSILRLTMAHCDVADPDDIETDGSETALDRAAQNLRSLIDSPETRVVDEILWIYEIQDCRRPGVRQIGLGGFASTDEIRTEANPTGAVIRNEGIREPKARGRATLIERTSALIGTVNLAIEDPDQKIAEQLEQIADSRRSSFEATDECGHIHRVWVVDNTAEVTALQALFAQIPCAYVADGNHRSAAAALLGKPDYLAVFFTCERMGLAPYNRLVAPKTSAVSDWEAGLNDTFEITRLDVDSFQPDETHAIGMYRSGHWWKLTPRDGCFDSSNAVQSIDSDIVQRHIFDGMLGITDPRDAQLTFVGGNKDAVYLRQQVDSGRHEFAITLAPVTMQQFVEVCRQNRFMPPKSTWFEPKIRSGLVSALLDPNLIPGAAEST